MMVKKIEEIVERALGRAGLMEIEPESREKLDRYIREVDGWSGRIHLVGRGRLGDNLELLVLDSLLLVRAAEASGVVIRRVADIGSGAGFPGVVWKIVRPGIEVTLFERRLKPALFLERMAMRLGLEGAEVVGDDAVRYEGEGTFDIVVSKAAGRLAGVLPLADRLLMANGAYITIKGRSWRSEIPKAPRGAMHFDSAAELPEGRGTVVLFRKQQMP